jgi:hypothetical protein|tara:strand:+ start:132 stop:878 length:747 start_codon:yes stop_codon:yes gene_type:complete
MNNIFILINKELLNIKKNIFQYVFILFLFPCLLYLFLTIPLSRVFINLKPIYPIWICSGILFVSILFNIYVLNYNWILKLYDNSFIKSLPVLSSEYLLSQILYSIIVGFFQSVITVIILNSLSIGFMTFIQFIKCFFIMLPSIIIIVNYSLIISYLVKNQFIINIANCLLFLFLSFSIGSFIPMNLYPVEYINIINYIPFSGTLINMQNIISYQPVFYNMFFISIFYSLFFSFVGYYIIEGKMKNHNE